ncbi:ComF family protein [Rathayibacter iranicus]|uniref:ComF family protein n=2 Tax=Rathayibacter iranicus TaxID=59737 RepID=A0AAD1AEM7_9MICO|nr:ComF family protein [Rathayibacter iranicus]AZZ55765.1 ComF family protein [Rathayibacter iranicus]MWV30811.1 ComF family protein [Rathayibacter iranicus NCPPB 2253 = VKM Ac-1602]PPI47533.1 hypothetical protein C5E09_06710 [Rathayibacter iranicus]PPI60378.1 hypothetical protein C5E08_07640 [Rathayibacter iranicus]PPI72161.1 hypothetical protein C5E01_06685 [Rathayibacter iranicus]
MLTDHLLDALAVLLPLDCPACGAAVSRVPCAPCARELAESAAMTRRSLGPPDDPLEVVTGAPYAGVVRRLVLALKEEGRTAAVRPLASVLRPALSAALHGSPAPLIAPPGSYASRVRRGIDPVALLVAGAGGRVESSLRRTRTLRDQVGLGRVERRGNLDGAFRARRSLAGAPGVVLVDDIVTSGATLLELRRAVRAAGAAVRGAVALAGTPLRSEPISGASR